MKNFFKYILSFLLIIGSVVFLIWFEKHVEINHWAYATAANFLFMIVFSLIFGPIFKPAFKSKYFTSKSFEKNGLIYNFFGIKYFSKLLRLIGWEKNLRKELPIKNNLESLQSFDYATRSSETNHTFAALSVVLLAVWFAARHSITDTLWLHGINILVNVYPIMLQRFNRPRVTRVLNLKVEYSKSKMPDFQ